MTLIVVACDFLHRENWILKSQSPLLCYKSNCFNHTWPSHKDIHFLSTTLCVFVRSLYKDLLYHQSSFHLNALINFNRYLVLRNRNFRKQKNYKAHNIRVGVWGCYTEKSPNPVELWTSSSGIGHPWFRQCYRFDCYRESEADVLVHQEF